MFTPYQREPIHHDGLRSMSATVAHTANAEPAPMCFEIWALKDFTDHIRSGITTEYHGPGINFEVVSKILSRSTTTPLNMHHRLYKAL
jgi:hypothetical protein